MLGYTKGPVVMSWSCIICRFLQRQLELLLQKNLIFHHLLALSKKQPCRAFLHYDWSKLPIVLFPFCSQSWPVFEKKKKQHGFNDLLTQFESTNWFTWQPPWSDIIVTSPAIVPKKKNQNKNRTKCDKFFQLFTRFSFFRFFSSSGFILTTASVSKLVGSAVLRRSSKRHFDWSQIVQAFFAQLKCTFPRLFCTVLFCIMVTSVGKKGWVFVHGVLRKEEREW